MGVMIAVVASVLAIALHVGLYLLFRSWMDRDLALSFAGDDAGKRGYMRECLQRAKRAKRAKREGVRRRDLPVWLEREAARYGRPG